MHPLNPFLRAFFRSTLPTQCSPVHHHILLVPTTEILLRARDSETHALYSDLASSEDFLASHVLRIPGGAASFQHSKDGASFRENRGKARQYSTANGRTVIIKDSLVYSNKGFKTLNQAQILYDVIYYPDAFEAQPWLVYFISRPLIGTYDPIPIIPASLEMPRSGAPGPTSPTQASQSASMSASSMPRKKEIKSFADLLNQFPMIARQMQPGLERLFKEFGKEFEKPLPAAPSHSRRSSQASRRSSSVSSTESLPASFHSGLSNGFIRNSSLELFDEEDLMRRCLETAVTAAIDLFQMVDKQQLSLLGATTDLTGPLVERMIERYITEQVHDSILFPRIRAVRRLDDIELESRVRQMADIDLSQVGIEIENGQRGKKELARRLSKGVEIFKKMGVAGGPQEMMEILLATLKLITSPEAVTKGPLPLSNSSRGIEELESEKHDAIMTINADTLVSLLLIVVIRSPVRHLKARLSYMRHFIFIDDVESGELGYALSTFEAVLAYLARHSGGLRKSSRQNRRLWHAAKEGEVVEIRSILEPHLSSSSEVIDDDDLCSDPPGFRRASRSLIDLTISDDTTIIGTHEHSTHSSRRNSLASRSQSQPGPLAHVFPFQRAVTPPPLDDMRPKAKKRVSMDTRSMSSSSGYSLHSRTNTIDSWSTGFEPDTSIENLARTQSSGGESVLMMAVEGGHAKSLQYLLTLSEFYPIEFVLEDWNNDNTTLLSAAVQHGNPQLVEVLLDFLFDHAPSNAVLWRYFAMQDIKGRCVAHYLFHLPNLISRIGHFLPWRLKDKNGQTPLFAFCRSYDHEEYKWMIDAALSAATSAQGDGQPLHLDDHVDNKGNTLLHIINDPHIAAKLLYHCDSDINAANDKQFTPLMVASKYGRVDLVRAFFGDPRLELSAKDLRGLTAVELAKDDEVRNRIDDLVLLSNDAAPDGRITTVVRSFFVEDGTIRLVVKSAAPNNNSTITVTTCRRSMVDFENLAKWLALEHPASWLPPAGYPLSPFLIPSKPSRAVLRDIQLKMDSFLKILLSHPTFSTHEMVWEFFLVPDIEPAMLAERSKRKAESRIDHIRDEYMPIADVREVELFVQHARESVRSVHHSTKSVLRRVNKIRFAAIDLADSATIASGAISTLTFLPTTHINAFNRYTKTLTQSEASPFTDFHYNMHAISTTISALLASLARPTTLIGSMQATQKLIDRHTLSLRRNDRWPLGLLDDARSRIQRDAADRIDKSLTELDTLGKELRHTQQTVAGELAAWQEWRVKMGRRTLKELARKMVVTERARLESMRRAIRGVGMNI